MEMLQWCYNKRQIQSKMECNKLYIPYDKWRLDCVVSENLALGKIDKVELTMSAQINEDFHGDTWGAYNTP